MNFQKTFNRPLYNHAVRISFGVERVKNIYSGAIAIDCLCFLQNTLSVHGTLGTYIMYLALWSCSEAFPPAGSLALLALGMGFNHTPQASQEQTPVQNFSVQLSIFKRDRIW